MSAGMQQPPALQTPMHMVKYLNMHSKYNLHKKHEWKSNETKGYSQRLENLTLFFKLHSSLQSTIKNFFKSAQFSSFHLNCSIKETNKKDKEKENI